VLLAGLLVPLQLLAAEYNYADQVTTDEININVDADEHPKPDANLHTATMDEYQAHLQSLHDLLQQCRANADACVADKVGSDEQVAGVGNQPGFGVHYGWLRDELSAAHDARQKDRDAGISDAMSHLDTAISEAGGSGSEALPDAKLAGSTAQRILSAPEYNRVKAPSLWDKFMARVQLWMNRFFFGVSVFGQKNPWLGVATYSSLLVLGLTLVALWAMRVSNRQKLAILRNYEAVKPMIANARLDWLELARQEAGQQHWRDAVHCLFWASIEVLEQRRLWQPNPARTPREYLRLLEPGSAPQRLLRMQMLRFERIWYGLHTAQNFDYNEALHVYEQLRSA
jgi:hypothetical protein